MYELPISNDGLSVVFVLFDFIENKWRDFQWATRTRYTLVYVFISTQSLLALAALIIYIPCQRLALVLASHYSRFEPISYKMLHQSSPERYLIFSLWSRLHGSKVYTYSCTQRNNLQWLLKWGSRYDIKLLMNSLDSSRNSRNRTHRYFKQSFHQ